MQKGEFSAKAIHATATKESWKPVEKIISGLIKLIPQNGRNHTGADIVTPVIGATAVN